MKTFTNADGDAMYQCEHCAHVYTNRQTMVAHETDCARLVEKRKQLDAERQARLADRLSEARAWARGNHPVKLLVKHDYDEEAKVLCRNWSRYNLWDCGTSSGWEEVFSEMLKAAHEQVLWENTPS